MGKVIAILISFVLIIGINNSYSQCNNDNLLIEGASELGDYKYIKHFNISLKKEKKKRVFKSYSIYLSANTQYLIISKNEISYESNLIFELYGPSGLIAKSYNKEKNRHYDKLEFQCKRSGNYYVLVYFKDGKEGCAICVIGFNQKA